MEILGGIGGGDLYMAAAFAVMLPIYEASQ